MKTIKVIDTIYTNKLLYQKSNTDAQRALAGYMIKAGYTQDPVFGGAFHLLKDVERCMYTDEIYYLAPYVDSDMVKKIVHVAQLALDGKFDKFAFSEREIKDIIKCLNEY